MFELSRLVSLLMTSATVAIGVTGCAQSPALERSTVASSTESNETAAPIAARDVEALVSLGPRVAGSPAAEQASAYLIEAYRQAGYVTQVQTFSYTKVEDQGSSLTIDRATDSITLEGRAFNGSKAGSLSAPLVVVPNPGRAADFEQVNVRGAIAVVERGEIRFLEKAKNAAAAGAVGLVITNNVPGDVSGTLGETVEIPVLSLSQEQGRSLLEQAGREPSQVTLNVNIAERTVTGRNIIAHLAGVTQPSVILGGHYDSVNGSPGANDNASGTAVVLDMARKLAETPFAQQVWFVAFDGEEDGLHGSRAFVREADAQFLSNLKGMLNFDMVGVNASLQVSGTPTLTRLADTLEQPLSTIGGGNWGSDHVPFAAADVPVLFFNRGQDPNYHSPNDLQVSAELLDETIQIGLDLVEKIVGSN